MLSDLYTTAMHRLISLPLVMAVAVSASCQTSRDTVDVLFIGNSYIYFNNLPAMVEGISMALDGPVVRGVAHTHGGMMLEEHVEDGHVDSLLEAGPADGTWERVILQEQSTLGARFREGPGALGSPEAFHTATRELASRIRAVDADPALFMTWAKEAFPDQIEPLSRAYLSIGSELDLDVAKVGEAWAEVRRLRPEFSLYTRDGSHPNAAGSYLAACVIYAMLTGESPLGAPTELRGAPWNRSGVVESSARSLLVSLSASDAEFLQEVAAEVAGVQPREAR
ncbi:MAG: hypothetical protein Rubg2KO_31420 [Rubricoccaceae bacterium]